MDDVETYVLKAQCAEFLETVRRAADDGDAAAFGASFLPEGVWRRPGVDPLVGSEAITAFMSRRPPERTTRHVTGGVVVEPVSPDRAVVDSQVVLYGGRLTGGGLPIAISGPEKVFEYRDTLQRTPEGWRIAERVTTVVFHAG
ncbi:MAG TPA: nuclear transport factor 2 family protein [Amycolatopsis sp.]|nr:nuclear transport factor 2 family protein [Amycolatopsis sp.]